MTFNQLGPAKTAERRPLCLNKISNLREEMADFGDMAAGPTSPGGRV